MTTTRISESRLLKENIGSVDSGKMRVRIIEGDRWGSSGYYTSEVLKRDGPIAFPAGTHMYINHPSESEEWDRPERSILDLAAILETDATYEKDGLYADVRVYSHWAEPIKEMADDIGLSIRALATAEEGEREGRKGLVFTSLVEGISVDFVTKAGAGGKVVSLVESARGAAKEILVQEGVIEEALSGNRRAQLQQVLSATLGDAWVNDFDEAESVVYYTAWFDGMGSKNYGQRYAPSEDDNSVTLDGERWEVIRQTNYVPAPATPVPTTSSESEQPHSEKEINVGDVTIKESELTALRESADRARTLETELSDAHKETTEARKDEAKAVRRANREQARRIVGEALSAARVKAPRLAESLSVDPPLLSEDDKETGAKEGTVDEAKLKEQVEEAISEITVETEEGGVRGFGAGRSKETEITEAKLAEKAASVFGRKVEEVKS